MGRNKKSRKMSNGKKLLIILVAITFVMALFTAFSLYKNSKNKTYSVGIIDGEDGPTAVLVSEEPVPVPVDTVEVGAENSAREPGAGVCAGGENDADGVAGCDIADLQLQNRDVSTNHISDCDLGHSEDSPLYFGNPSDAAMDVNLETNYLMEKDNYTLSYNNETLCPNWVGWHLSSEDLGDAGRSNKFAEDKELPDGWYGVTKADYKYNAYGFDRGHICPSADRTATAESNKETFLMTNMVPQSPENNRVVWVALEKYQREIVDAGNEVYIFAGPAGTGGIGDRGYFDYILLNGAGPDGSDLKINVPAYTWKILLVIPDGEDDLTRINENTEVIAVCIPNKKGINSDLSWKKYLCSVDDIERLTGYDFFELLDDSIEEKLESSVADADSL